MARGQKRVSQSESMTDTATKRVTRSQTRRDQQQPPTTIATTRATPRPTSSTAAPVTPFPVAMPPAVAPVTPAPAFMPTLVGHDGLLTDRLLPFLLTDDLANVCEAIGATRLGRGLLRDTSLWQYVTTRDGLTGATTTTPTVACSAGCGELTTYLSRRSQLESFDSNIVVLAGNLETIRYVDDVAVDCLAFPTSSSFLNPGIGVAGCVHRRIAKDLSRYIPTRDQRPDVREVLTTPGNDADIKLLVHCVGPSRFDRDRRVRLYTTYTKALQAIEKATEVHCAAFASISTGTLQYPKKEAAEIALAAVRDRMRAHRWPAQKRVAFVCLDKDVLSAFTQAHALVRRTFFTAGAAYPASVQEAVVP